VRTKLANFVRARWFAPPFGGPGFTRLLLDAFDAMRSGGRQEPLLPHYQPLDLFVTVTDFHGFPQKLRLNSPAEVTETEHRLTLSFRDPGGADRQLGDTAELVFAGRGTASFPGAFPPFQVAELDNVLEERGQSWPGRAAFLARALPQRSSPEAAVLIDGSVLANAPFRPAMDALQNRPTRREVDRRFVYIDPKPDIRSVRLTAADDSESPGFFATIFGALSDIPREQPISDNLEAIDGRSARIRRLRHIVETMRPEVELAIERLFGTTLLLGRPNAKRLAAWRTKAQQAAARQAGYAYAAYGHLKVAAVTEEIAALLHRLSDSGEVAGPGKERQEAIRQAVWSAVRRTGLTAEDALTSAGARPHVIDFLRSFDLNYRIRRLRSVARLITTISERHDRSPDGLDQARAVIYDLVGRYRSRAAIDQPLDVDPAARPAEAMLWLADRLDLKAADDQADARFAELLDGLRKPERRALILAYLGFPFYDVATLPLLQGEGLG
jgi:patatin-related protein